MQAKNLTQLRNTLIKTLSDLSIDAITPTKASAAANVAGKVIGTLTTEINYAQLHGRTPIIKYIEDQSTD